MRLPEARERDHGRRDDCRRSCPGVDPECTAVVEKRFVKHGGKVMKSAKALGYERSKDGSLAVQRRASDGGKFETVVADVVLVAVGMRPNGAGLGLEEIGVKVERGFVPTDNVGRTNVPGIYAIGDVSGDADARAQGDEGGRGRRRGHRRPQGGEGLGRRSRPPSSPTPRSRRRASPSSRRRRRGSTSASASSRSPRWAARWR